MEVSKCDSWIGSCRSEGRSWRSEGRNRRVSQTCSRTCLNRFINLAGSRFNRSSRCCGVSCRGRSLRRSSQVSHRVARSFCVGCWRGASPAGPVIDAAGASFLVILIGKRDFRSEELGNKTQLMKGRHLHLVHMSTHFLLLTDQQEGIRESKWGPKWEICIQVLPVLWTLATFPRESTFESGKKKTV